MGDLILPEMTLAEAQRTHEAIKAGIVTVRALLFDMRDRKGWIALGYESFAEYGEQALGWKKSALNQEVMALL